MTAQFDALRAQAFAALQRGDFANAKKLFKQGFDAGDTHRNTAAGLTYSARHTKDFQLSYDAAEAWLKLEPHSWEALLLKADALEGLGKFLDASTFYSAAIGVAPPYDQATPNARAELDRAQARVRQATARYQSHLSDVMTAAGFDPGDGSSRMAQALDIAAGRKSHYFQQPLKFFFPELPQRQFYHRSEFDWAPSIEAALPQIIEEAINVLAEDGLFEPYIQHNPRAPSVADLSLVDNNDWAAVHLIRDGEILEENAARVPSIMKALDAAPLPNVPGLAPSVLLSRLKPGMHITPHTGLTNARLLCHAPLVIPENCWIRVGNQVRTWTPGELLIFDDSVEHEAKNDSSETRLVLIFDIWRPELTEEERNFVRHLFGAIESFG